MKKRLLSFLLAAAVAVTILPAMPLTAEAKIHCEDSVRYLGHLTDENNVITQHASVRALGTLEMPDELTLAAAPHYKSAKNAGLYLREQMKKRSNAVCITFDPEAFRTGAALDEIYLDIFHVAVAHTGDGTEGDYLNVQRANTDFSAWEDHENNRIITLFQFKWRTTAEEEAEIMDLICEMETQMSVGTDIEEIRLRTVYQYMMENLTYDYDSYNKHMQAKQNGTDPDDDRISSQSFTAYGAVKRKTAVCQGLACLMYRILLDRGIDNRIITSDTHAWNAVCMDGKWYMCDITFDLQNNPRNPKYCLLSREKMDKVGSHQWNAENCFDYETINAYNWSAYGWDSWTEFITRGFEEVVKLVKGNEDGEQKKLKIYDMDGNELESGVDYEIAYVRNYNGYQTVITGKGKYEGQSLTRDYQKKLGTVKIKKITREVVKKRNKRKVGGANYPAEYALITKVYFDPIPGAYGYIVQSDNDIYEAATCKKTQLKSGMMCHTITTKFTEFTNSKTEAINRYHKRIQKSKKEKSEFMKNRDPSLPVLFDLSFFGIYDIKSSLSIRVYAMSADPLRVASTTSKLYTIKAGKTSVKF